MGSYHTIQGDTWDVIAKRVYGAEKCADYLMAGNWALLDYLIFPSGVVVKVTDLPKAEDLGLPIWRD